MHSAMIYSSARSRSACADRHNPYRHGAMIYSSARSRGFCGRSYGITTQAQFPTRLRDMPVAASRPRRAPGGMFRINLVCVCALVPAARTFAVKALRQPPRHKNYSASLIGCRRCRPKPPKRPLDNHPRPVTHPASLHARRRWPTASWRRSGHKGRRQQAGSLRPG